MDKINKEIQEQLFSAETKTVLSALDAVSKKGNKLYIPILFDLLNSSPENEIEEAITKLLATVKDKETVESFVDAIKNEKYKPILRTILTVCWQNGLDFSNYLPVFVQVIINEEWEVAFEAFTIIDNLEFLPEQKIIDETKQIIKNTSKLKDEQKAYFLKEVMAKIN